MFAAENIIYKNNYIKGDEEKLNKFVRTLDKRAEKGVDIVERKRR